MKTPFLAVALLAAIASSPTTALADAPCAVPFQRSGSLPLPVNYGGTTASLFVPAGYRLHLEYVSATITIGSGGRPWFTVSTTAGGQSATYPLPALTGYNVYDRQASQAVSLYADPGTAVYVRMYRGTVATTATTAGYAVSGCLHPI